MLRPLTYLSASGLVLVAVATTMGVDLAGMLLRGELIDEWSLALAHAIGFGAAIWVGLQGSGDVPAREVLGARRFRPVLVLALVPLAIGASVLLAEIDNWVQEGIPATAEEIASLSSELSPGGFWQAAAVFLHVVVLAPILEEALFRGVLQQRLAAGYGRPLAIVFTAGAFALAHFGGSPTRFLPELVLAGLALGFVADRTGSAAASAIVHVAFNAAPLVLSARVLYMPGWNAVDRAARGQPDHVPFLFTGLALALATSGLFVVARLAPREAA